jgi:hypothetical protein
VAGAAMSTTRSINTTQQHDVCDVCERTLLRGEQIEVFVSSGRRYSVCELCKPHALHEGWMREGAIPDYSDTSGVPERRRSLFGRRRARNTRADRDARTGRAGASTEPTGPPTLDDELGDRPRRSLPIALPATSRGRENADDRIREPRHVHAIPTSGDHKIVAAIDSFNHSEHRRTVSGVARSLGVAGVNVTPDASVASLVWIVVSWELCWYRYEVDLSESRGAVRLAGQGYELDELAEHERYENASADESGALTIP